MPDELDLTRTCESCGAPMTWEQSECGCEWWQCTPCDKVVWLHKCRLGEEQE